MKKADLNRCVTLQTCAVPDSMFSKKTSTVLSIAMSMLLVPSAYALRVNIAINEGVSDSGLPLIEAGVTEGDTLTFSVSSGFILREQMGNAKCTVQGRLGLAAGSSASASDITFDRNGAFSYDIDFSDTEPQAGVARVQAVVNRDTELDEQEQFSVTIEDDSVQMDCTGTGDEVIEQPSFRGWGSVVNRNDDYAFELYKINIIEGLAPEPDDPVDISPGTDGGTGTSEARNILLKQLQAATDIALFNAHSKTRSIARELARRRRDENGFSSDNLSIKLNGHSFALGQYQSHAKEDEKTSLGRWGGFVSGSIELGETDDDSNLDVEFGSSLITAGVDLQMQQWVLGMAVSFADSDADVSAVKDATKLSQNGISVFASYYGDAFYLDVILSSSRSRYDFTSSDINTSVQPSTDGNDVGFALGTGVEGHVGKTDYSFFFLYDYVDLSVDGFAESNGVNVNDFDRVSQQVELGSRISYNLNSSIGVFVPFASISYRDELETDPTVLSFSQNTQNASQATFATNEGGSYVSAQVGVSAVFPHGVSIFASYENDINDDQWDRQRYDLGVRWAY